MRRRLFLNKPGYNSVATIFAEVHRGSYSLKMTDCDHSVTFDISGYDKAGKANTLYKVDLMIKVLTEFRAALATDFARSD